MASNTNPTAALALSRRGMERMSRLPGRGWAERRMNALFGAALPTMDNRQLAHPSASEQAD
jgi:hypothetical protein